jgi:hypothetical protein
MCNAAEQEGGACARLWNEPSNSFYYSINHEGAVFCDPPKGEVQKEEQCAALMSSTANAW